MASISRSELLLRLLPKSSGRKWTPSVASPALTQTQQKPPRVIQYRRQQVWRQLASKYPWTKEEDELLCRTIARFVLGENANGTRPRDDDDDAWIFNGDKTPPTNLPDFVSPSSIPWREIASSLAQSDQVKKGGFVLRSPSACKTRFRWLLLPASTLNSEQQEISKILDSEETAMQKLKFQWTPEEEKRWARVRDLLRRQRPLSLEALATERPAMAAHLKTKSSMNNTNASSKSEEQHQIASTNETIGKGPQHNVHSGTWPIEIDWGILSRFIGGRTIGECQRRLQWELSSHAHLSPTLNR